MTIISDGCVMAAIAYSVVQKTGRQALTNENNADTRLEWIEPAVTTLQLSETAGNPGRGGDRGPYIDCTRS